MECQALMSGVALWRSVHLEIVSLGKDAGVSIVHPRISNLLSPAFMDYQSVGDYRQME